MNLPGFRAEASIYTSVLSYRLAWMGDGGSHFHHEIGQLVPQLPSGSQPDGNGDGVCVTGCLDCESDINSPTGCSKECIARNCNHFQRSCTGCENPCEGGQFCRGKCTDTSKDRNNCGSCGNVCDTGVSCLNGICGCPTGQIKCNGICTDTNNSSSNCGSCGNACAAGQICQNGSCVAANCRVFCSDWNRCNQTCGKWPPGFSNYQCWLDCLQTDVDCLNTTCS